MINISKTYLLAAQVKHRLTQEAVSHDVDLRRLVCQANMLDGMIEEMNMGRTGKVTFENLAMDVPSSLVRRLAGGRHAHKSHGYGRRSQGRMGEINADEDSEFDECSDSSDSDSSDDYSSSDSSSDSESDDEIYEYDDCADYDEHEIGYTYELRAEDKYMAKPTVVDADEAMGLHRVLSDKCSDGVHIQTLACI